jgi:hypothetical protein
MKAEAWMNRDERPLGQRISDLKSLAQDLRADAERKDREAQQLRQQAVEVDRRIENLRTTR